MNTPTLTPLPPRLRFEPPAHSPPRSAPHSPLRSPSRQRLLDDILSDLTPSTTLEAITSPSGKLRASVEAASPSERAFGVRATTASKKIQEWVDELSDWPWPEVPGSEGFELPRSKRRKIIFDDMEETKSQGPKLPSYPEESDSVEYLGSLPSCDVFAYEKRVDDIQEEMEDLDVEEIKRTVLNNYFSPNSRPSSSASNVAPMPSFLSSYTKMEDFTAIVAATVLQALPNLARLNRLLGAWSIRLSVLKKVPTMYEMLDDVEIALRSGWQALEVAERNDGTDPGAESYLERSTYEIMREVLQDKVTPPGQLLDQMLDSLEGREDTLPGVWLDRMQDIETDYGNWVVSGDRKVRQGEWARAEFRKKELADAAAAEEAARVSRKAEEDLARREYEEELRRGIEAARLKSELALKDRNDALLKEREDLAAVVRSEEARVQEIIENELREKMEKEIRNAELRKQHALRDAEVVDTKEIFESDAEGHIRSASPVGLYDGSNDSKISRRRDSGSSARSEKEKLLPNAQSELSDSGSSSTPTPSSGINDNTQAIQHDLNGFIISNALRQRYQAPEARTQYVQHTTKLLHQLENNRSQATETKEKQALDDTVYALKDILRETDMIDAQEHIDFLTNLSDRVLPVELMNLVQDAARVPLVFPLEESHTPKDLNPREMLENLARTANSVDSQILKEELQQASMNGHAFLKMETARQSANAENLQALVQRVEHLALKVPTSDSESIAVALDADSLRHALDSGAHLTAGERMARHHGLDGASDKVIKDEGSSPAHSSDLIRNLEITTGHSATTVTTSQPIMLDSNISTGRKRSSGSTSVSYLSSQSGLSKPRSMSLPRPTPLGPHIPSIDKAPSLKRVQSETTPGNSLLTHSSIVFKDSEDWTYVKPLPASPKTRAEDSIVDNPPPSKRHSRNVSLVKDFTKLSSEYNHDRAEYFRMYPSAEIMEAPLSSVPSLSPTIAIGQIPPVPISSNEYSDSEPHSPFSSNDGASESKIFKIPSEHELGDIEMCHPPSTQPQSASGQNLSEYSPLSFDASLHSFCNSQVPSSPPMSIISPRPFEEHGLSNSTLNDFSYLNEMPRTPSLPPPALANRCRGYECSCDCPRCVEYGRTESSSSEISLLHGTATEPKVHSASSSDEAPDLEPVSIALRNEYPSRSEVLQAPFLPLAAPQRNPWQEELNNSTLPLVKNPLLQADAPDKISSDIIATHIPSSSSSETSSPVEPHIHLGSRPSTPSPHPTDSQSQPSTPIRTASSAIIPRTPDSSKSSSTIVAGSPMIYTGSPLRATIGGPIESGNSPESVYSAPDISSSLSADKLSALELGVPFPVPTSPKKNVTTDEQIQAQISTLLESIPTLRLAAEAAPDTHLTTFSSPREEGLRLNKTRRSLPAYTRPSSSLSTRSSTPAFTLQPAYNKSNAGPRHNFNHPEIRVYHLSRQGDTAPIKLHIRRVGESGERLMVRTGGGWADLGEYLTAYISHHGRRVASGTGEDKVEVQNLHTSRGGRTASGPIPALRSVRSIIGSGRDSPTPRPSSVLGMERPMSSLYVRKSRKSVGTVESSASQVFIDPSTPPKAAGTASPPSAGTPRSASRMEWNEEEPGLGLAGPKSKVKHISEFEQEWVRSTTEKVKQASAEKERERNRKSFGETGSAQRKLFKKG